MSIKIQRNGHDVWDDDFALEIRQSDFVSVDKLIDHLELVAQVPTAFGEPTSAAARGAINLINVLAEQAGINNVDELGVWVRS